jgi:hypothetical protein
VRLLTVLERQTIVVDHDLEPVAFNEWTRLGEVQRHHGNVFGVDVGPDVDLGPVRQREHADAVAAAQATVVEIPELGDAGSSGPSDAANRGS